MPAPNPIYIIDLMGDNANPPGGVFAKHLASSLIDLKLGPSLLNGSTRGRLYESVLEIERQVGGNKPFFPVVHFFGHGNADGIAVHENSESVDWTQLREVLRPLQQTSQGNIVFCFDVCHGLKGFKIARRFFPLPFLALIGPNQPIGGVESLRAFTEFYKAASVDIADLDNAVNRMNVASGYADERYEWVIGTKWTFDFTGKTKGIDLIPDD